MSGFKDRGFNERLSTANNAKQAMTNKFLQRPRPDDPAMIEQRAARVAVNVAREARRAEREAIRISEAARIVAEREARAAAAADEKERAAAGKAASDATLERQRKAARDARYAARKARK